MWLFGVYFGWEEWRAVLVSGLIGPAIVIAVLLLGGCENSEGLVSSDRTTFDPPVWYGDLWAEVESCSGLSGDWRRITWWRSRTLPNNYAAVWFSPHDIYLSDELLYNSVDFKLRTNIKHEMLHDLIQSTEHPEVFVTCNLHQPGTS